MANATHEAALTARDTTRGIRDTVKDVEKSGVVSDTAKAMDEAASAAAETARAAKGTALQLPKGAPKTRKMVKRGARHATREANAEGHQAE